MEYFSTIEEKNKGTLSRLSLNLKRKQLAFGVVYSYSKY